MLTATDLRTSKTAKIKVILLYHCTSTYANVQQYSNITCKYCKIHSRSNFQDARNSIRRSAAERLQANYVSLL